MRVKEIQSTQNPWFKEVKNLIENNRFRKKQGLFSVEGFKEIALALQAGFVIKHIAFVVENVNMAVDFEHLSLPNSVEWVSLSAPLMSELCVRNEARNALAVFEWMELPVRNHTDAAAIMIVEKVEKPGNLGAILRSAEASGIHEVWLCDANVDPFHPQVIRNSLGTVFHVPVKSYSFERCLERIAEAQLQVFTTFMDDAKIMYEADLKQPFVVVLGTEHEGVSERWRGLGQNVQIPMLGTIDSLNVSVASAVLMYEMVRQRRN